MVRPINASGYRGSKKWFDHFTAAEREQKKKEREETAKQKAESVAKKKEEAAKKEEEAARKRRRLQEKGLKNLPT